MQTFYYTYNLYKYEIITACIIMYFYINIKLTYHELKDRTKNYVLNENSQWINDEIILSFQSVHHFKDNIDFFIDYLKRGNIDPNYFLQKQLNINVQWDDIKKWPHQQAFFLYEIIAAIICYKRYSTTTTLNITNIYQKMKCIIKFSKQILKKTNLCYNKYYLLNIKKFQPPKLKRAQCDINENAQIKKNMIKIHNLTQNFIQNSQLMKPFMIFFSGIDGCIMENIDWKNQMFHKEISFACQDKCFVGCNKVLNLTNTSSQCIIYDLNKIEIGITTSKSCTTCKTQHRHNNIITQNNVYFLPISTTKYFELSPETIFSKELLYDFGIHFLNHGIGADAYAEIYNDRNDCMINHIKQRVKQIGHRHDTIKLERNKLSSAFFLFFAIKYIYTYDLIENNKMNNTYISEQIYLNSTRIKPCEPKQKKRKLSYSINDDKLKNDNVIFFEHNNKLIYLTKNEIEMEKKKLMLYSNIMSNKQIQLLQYGKVVWKGNVEFATGTWCLIDLDYPIGFTDGSIWGYVYKSGVKKNHGLFLPEKCIDFENKQQKYFTDYRIYWNILYDKYLENGMKNVINPMLHAIPVQNGIPPPAVSQIYGDGNEKIDLKICNMHPFLLKLLSSQTYINVSKLEQSQRETYQCINMPYQGNAFVSSSKLCANHFIMVWIFTGLPACKVNKFIDFVHIRLRINQIYKKLNQRKQLTKHEHNKLTQWNEYNKDDKQLFENTISSLLYLHKLQEYRKITKIIQFKKPDIVTLNQSFDDNENNVSNDLKLVYLNDTCMFFNIFCY